MFGVVFISGYLFGTLSQTRNALDNRHALQAFLFVVFGIYFVWFWAKGQTLAMKTWRIRVVDKHGAALSWARALLRYLLVWLWFLPGLALARLLDAQGWMLVLIPSLNFVLWTAAVYLQAERQFPHDWIAGTRLIQLPAPQKKSAKPATDQA